MSEILYEPKRIPANLNLAFVGAKQIKEGGTKVECLSARDILFPNFDFENDDIRLQQRTLDAAEAKLCKERLKRFSAFIAFPKDSKRLITTIIHNHDKKVIPDDSVIFITSLRLYHAEYLSSTFFRVWFEYFLLLRKEKFDFIEVFETFPFPEKQGYNAPRSDYFSYLDYATRHDISIEEAYDKLNSGLFGDKFDHYCPADWELARHFHLPKKYQTDKAKILDCILTACKKSEIQQAV